MVLQATENNVKREIKAVAIPFFRLAFRPFFWLGACFGALCVALWSLNFAGTITFHPLGGGFFWHLHEMLFGFTAAIIAGFLLTAVQNWTNVPSIKGMALAALVGIWLSARILLLFPSLLPTSLIIAIDLLFLPLAALALSIPIIKVRQWRNLFFIPILLLMATVNGLSYMALLGVVLVSYVEIAYVMVMLVALVMTIMGGRVFPMFTANGTGTPRVAAIAWLEKTAIALVIASVVVTSTILELPNTLVGMVYLLTGLVNFIRALRWRIWVTFTVPLVWSLHLSYWAMCLGFVQLGLVKLELLANSSIGLHAITVGGIGLMILSMIARVSLGHTGRPIRAGRLVSCSIIMMCMSLLIRVVLPYLVQDYVWIILGSAFFWVLAFGGFVVAYTKVLFSARADGRPG